MTTMTASPRIKGSAIAPMEIRVPERLRVLIADDEHLVATGLASMVIALGHEVVAIAADGASAVDLAREKRPDLSLLDIRMPMKSGIEAAAEIDEQLQIPTIIVSAYSDQEHLDKIKSYGLSGGIYGYLLKPVEREDLRVSMTVAVQRAATERNLADRVHQLEKNLATRRTLEQAKWVLVQKRQFSEQQAHERIQKLARDQRRPIADIAAEIIAKGDVVG